MCLRLCASAASKPFFFKERQEKMSEKNKRQYESNIIGLPPLKMVLGNVPEPDPGEGRRPFKVFASEKPEEARVTLEKLIGHLQEPKK
jgi:hypothetical protein